MARKIKYQKYVLEDQIPDIIKEKFPNCECSDCHHDALYGGTVETQYDEKTDEYVVLSFGIFCKDCGAVYGKWDNTNREYFLGRSKW